MKKMISSTFFAFTPAYCSADKAMTAEPVVDYSAVEVACKGLNVFMKTDLVATR
jgi:hypothetical protein